MNGYSAFGIESSAWRSGFEAGKRAATALKEHDVTAEEAILHIKKILDAFDEEYDNMNAVIQMRKEANMMSEVIDKIRYIADEVKE